MPMIAGTQLGPYEIVAPLGAGGMGEVYRARDSRLRRDVAIKVLPDDVASSPDRLARFEREATTVAGLNHPNIVTLHSIEDVGGTRFLTMELVEGPSLASFVVPGGLAPERVIEFATALADALVAAHEKGIVHRDLKPANVMVTRDGRLKVLDFGLAKLTQRDPNAAAGSATLAPTDSAPGEIAGTAPYMAPEQIRGETVDARTDLFSLGVLLYELASGSRPFGGRTTPDVASSILRDAPQPLTRLRSDLPNGLVRIVERCLEKEPRARFQTALDVRNELEALRRTLEPAATPGAGVASIAVLPFVNRSASAEDEYFSDGLADELLNVLAKIRGLRVAARTSAFHFKGKDTTIPEVGHALNVATVLEGSVRKAGTRVRISVQLVKVADGYHLWSETYDRTLDDIFAVQDDIARSVVKELRSTLLGELENAERSDRVHAEVAQAGRGRGESTEAHRLALQGRHFLERMTRDDVLRGIGYLEEALRLDPDHAIAWVDLARSHLVTAGYGWEPIATGVETARAATERALRIEPDLADAHAILGRLRLYFDRDWKGAEASYRRAMELAPGNLSRLHGAGILALHAGRVEEALDLYRRAVDQDPLSAAAYHRLGMGCIAARRLAEAEAALRKAIELAPHRVLAHSHLALVLLAQGRLEEARVAVEAEGEEIYRLVAQAGLDHVLGRATEAAEALRTLIEKYSEYGAFQIAEAHAACGDKDSAFEWLERAHAQRDPGLMELVGSLPLMSLHDDPRWRAFLETKMGTP